MAHGLRLGLPLDQAPVICVQLAQCSGANCAPQLLVASVSYVDTPLVELHVESSVLATETAAQLSSAGQAAQRIAI